MEAAQVTGRQWSLDYAVGQQHIRNSAVESQELSTYCLISMLVIATIHQKKKDDGKEEMLGCDYHAYFPE